MVQFEIKRLPVYDEAEVLAEIRRVAELCDSKRMSKSYFTKYSRISSTTAMRYFGSWSEVLHRAGHPDLYGGPELTDKMRLQKSRDLTNEELIRELQKLASESGGQLTGKIVNSSARIHSDVLRSRFGSLHNALQASGISPSNRGTRHTDLDCFENLLTVWSHLGRPPKYSEMARAPSVVGGKAYLHRFGTWNKALIAFVNRANANDAETPSPSRSDDVNPDVALAKTKSAPASERREIPLGLRFVVLRRDRFRCATCGDSPAESLSCSLHVDHIIPFSKGGRTVIDNLRSLCATCNVGRGNRYSD